MHRVCRTTIVFALLVAFQWAPYALAPLLGGEPSGGEESRSEPSRDAKIAKWIEQLGSDKYLTRERASKELARVGRPAIPALARAADGDELERATRAIRVLLLLSDSRDNQTSYDALNVVAELKNRPLERSAALSRLAQLRETRAIPKVLEAGGLVVAPGDPQLPGKRTLDSPDGLIRCLKINETWRGGVEGLSHVNELKSLNELSLFSGTIDDEGLARLHDLPNLFSLRIYGTRATAEGVAKLKERMPHIRMVEFRGGALLGVRANATNAPAVIDTVTVNSAAERADLRPLDVILAFNGKPMANFKVLREEIAGLNAGDEATILIRRNGENLTKKIKFGRWK